MVSGDLLRKLFRSHAEHDDTGFKTAAEAVIREERLKNHRLLADDLEKILLSRNGRRGHKSTPPALQYELPRDQDRGFPLIDISRFDYDWSGLVAPSSTTAALEQMV